VKKLWLVVALVALGGLTSKTFADVQNIRLSGDIRLRGYFMIALVMTAQAQLILRSRGIPHSSRNEHGFRSKLTSKTTCSS